MHKLLSRFTFAVALLLATLTTARASPGTDLLPTLQTYSGLFNWIASVSTDPVEVSYFTNAAVAMDTSYAIIDGGDENPATFDYLAQQAYGQASIWQGYPEAVAAFTGLGDGYAAVATWLSPP